MYKPKFKKTDYLLFLLSEIKVLQKSIFEASIIPQWEIKLRREALIKSAHASTSIEGNSLTLDEVSQVLLNRENIGIRREQKEVKNYYKSFINLDRLKEKQLLEEKDILAIHLWIMKGLNDKAGKWRKTQVVVGNRVTKKVTYLAPGAKKVPRLIKELIGWYNNQNQYFNIVLKAAIIHYRLVWIHPFNDGNGRTARALATLILLREKFDIKRFFTLDDYYDADRGSYFKVIQDTNKSGDLSEWLVYFSEGLLQSLQAVDRKIKKLTKMVPGFLGKGQLKISKHEERILELVNKKTEIQSKDVQKEFNITRQASHKLLVKMIKKGFLKQIGGGRSVKYILKQ